MSLKPRQVRAIAHYLSSHGNLRLSLQSRADQVYFSDKSSGATVTVPMDEVLNSYDEDRNERARVRRYVRRQEQQQQGAGR